LVISTLSWGFHYPISTYIKSVFNLLNDKGLLILDLRKGETSNEELRKLLENFNIEIINSKRKYHFRHSILNSISSLVIFSVT